jgi:predicted secreted hydrolase
MHRLALASLALAWAVLPAHAFDPVVQGKPLEFPRDYGSHPGHRIEWWYVTGHLDSAGGALGFQVTFFRVRNPDAESVPGRFSPRQILFAHAALADAPRGRFLHDERVGRVLPDLVDARVGDTGVRLDDWMLARESGGYRTRVAADGFAFDLVLTPTQPPLLQGDRGFSRKGPLPEQASYYYSEPQLRVEGKVNAKGEVREVRGVAWLDHEWSSEMLASDASGWDWLGANLEDGAALTARRVGIRSPSRARRCSSPFAARGNRRARAPRIRSRWMCALPIGRISSSRCSKTRSSMRVRAPGRCIGRGRCASRGETV